MNKLLSRKDIAVLTGMTVDEVSANEERLGLRPIRINARNIKYERAAALLALKNAGLLPPTL
jgi:hypothetical protein